ncbi:MAG: MSHA biogenesis protein MshG [Gammaproteobacteria bacterium CG22_combo_CG10-13_8_21_14_all_40_8]|nr:MAG: MSHA biogenesis protein MshG [Gammaproteobacteria bacterium CG22_combo_CG10-13_8_21_14_all_40_8]
MALFLYRARNNLGEEIRGEVEASSVNAVAAILAGQKIIPVEISTKKLEKEGIDFNHLSFSKKQNIKIEELVMLCRQLASLLKAGVPTVQAINGLALSAGNPTLSESLKKIENALEAGTPLAASLQQQSDIYNPLFVAMVSVGENTGQLDDAFRKLSSYLELEKVTLQRIKQATRYPTMVVSAISGALVIMNWLVIPQFAKLFQKFGADLPLPTRILIGTSHFFQNYWGLLLFLLVGGIVGFKHWKKTEEGHFKWDSWVLKIPLLGPLFEKIVLGRFSRTFAMTYAAGVPILQSLSVVARAVSNKFVEKAVLNMRGGIERGDSFTHTANASGMFSPLVLQMVSVGEQTGALDSLLNEVADFYEQEVEYDLKKLSDAIEPILLVFMGVMVLILALGIFLPMWDMFGLMTKNG